MTAPCLLHCREANSSPGQQDPVPCLSGSQGSFSPKIEIFVFIKLEYTWKAHLQTEWVGTTALDCSCTSVRSRWLQQLEFSELHTSLTAWEGTWTQKLMAKQVSTGAQLIPPIFKIAPLPMKSISEVTRWKCYSWQPNSIKTNAKISADFPCQGLQWRFRLQSVAHRYIQYSFLLLIFGIEETHVCSLQKVNRLNYLRNSRKTRLLLEPYFILITSSYLIPLLLKRWTSTHVPQKF